jgi:hypothetical protein
MLSIYSSSTENPSDSYPVLNAFTYLCRVPPFFLGGDVGGACFDVS